MTKEGAVDKVRKLLRLARDKSATENEAAVAMQMAQRLMMEHDIQDVEDAVEQVAIRGDWKSFKLGQRWQGFLVSAVCELYSCRAVLRKRGNQVRFYGKQSTILVATDTLDWINDQVSDLFKEALVALKGRVSGGDRLDDGLHSEFRKTFKEACAIRIYQRAKEIVAISRNEIPSHMALIVIDQAKAAADDLLREDGFEKSRAVSVRGGIGTGGGRSAGDQVRLSHGVQSQPARRIAS